MPVCADPGLRAFLEREVPRAVRTACRVLADSESTKRDLLQLLDVPDDKITVVPPGVEARFAPVLVEDVLGVVRARYNLPQRFILSVGTLEPRKNLSRLIIAYGQLRQRKGFSHSLVIAGKPGWLFQDVFDRVAQEGVTEHVHFIGFVADEHLAALYSLADLFVFPSLYEGFGLPPLEAMACGTPVVVGNNSSLPEVVSDAGLLINAEDVDGMANAMARVLEDAEVEARLTELGLAQAARFTWEASARTLLVAYQLTAR